MFWRFGGYANNSAIDTLLDKQDCSLEELLDESDIIQELKQHNAKLVEFLRDDSVLEKLLDYVVAPKSRKPTQHEDNEPSEDDAEGSEGKDKGISSPRFAGDSLEKITDEEDEEKEKKRNRYAYVSAEVLSSDTWSLTEALLEKEDTLRKFWDFLKGPVPLDPLQASYFTKVNESLLDKKTEQMLNLFKSIEDVVPTMLRHVDSPMVMDLLLKIISLEKAEGGEGVVDWLHSQNTMPILLGFLSSEHSWATQTSAGDFLKAIITISANASQNEQSCIGPNELTRQLVSLPCIEKLISDMLKGGNPLTVGVGIVIEVIRKNNSDYDPEVGSEANSVPSSRDPIYLGTLLRMFAKHVPDFMALILSPNHTIGGGDGLMTIKRKELNAAFGSKIEPLGFDRFKTCELMAELLHCSNMGLLNEPGSEEYVQARNLERERLRAEGKLNAIRGDRPDSINDDLTMNSMDNSRFDTDSPDGMRKIEDMQALQTQNNPDDDGFEEVTRDLGDEAKDDFDEVLSTKPESLSFLDKDDEVFVDEPLSSPRLQHSDIVPGNIVHAEDIPAPLSPSKVSIAELSQKEIAEVGHEDDGKKIGSETTPDIETSHNTPTDIEESILNSLSLKGPTDTSMDAVDGSEVGESKLAIVSSPTTDIPAGVGATDDGDFSPHPEDQPAPLFAKKAESLPATGSENPGSESLLPDSGATPEASGSREDADTTMAEVPGSRYIPQGSAAERSRLEANVQPIPVVGDYLKMQFVEHKVVPTILDFFFRFPWNNFLHNVVYDVVQQVFNGPMDRGYNRTLAIDLFETGDITSRIVDGQKRSDEAQAQDRMRLGYMGHLTLIAEEVVKFTDRHPPDELALNSVLEKVINKDWATYVDFTLTETRDRDNAILGGVRPDMSVGPRQAVMNAVNAATGFGGAASSVLADAGLNGSLGLDSVDLGNGNGSNGGAFTMTSASALSGFGSSSDEEEDEMDDDLEEEGKASSGGAEFSRYITTPSTTTATSQPGSELEPPSAPPPPPPAIKITPSRARRQLAARLALHKQNAENSSENGGSDAFYQAEQAEHRESLNPFATEEDDDEEAGGDNDDFTIGDLEIDEEGKGHIPPVSPLTGKKMPLLNSSDEDSDSDDGFGQPIGKDENGSPKERRPSTTEALRRTSLEDDDESDDVVHVTVGLRTTGVEKPTETEKRFAAEGAAASEGNASTPPAYQDDEELVEARHTAT